MHERVRRALLTRLGAPVARAGPAPRVPRDTIGPAKKAPNATIAESMWRKSQKDCMGVVLVAPLRWLALPHPPAG